MLSCYIDTEPEYWVTEKYPEVPLSQPKILSLFNEIFETYNSAAGLPSSCADMDL
jgi:hypothetical protein